MKKMQDNFENNQDTLKRDESEAKIIADNLLTAVGNAQPDIETTCSIKTIYLVVYVNTIGSLC